MTAPTPTATAPAQPATAPPADTGGAKPAAPGLAQAATETGATAAVAEGTDGGSWSAPGAAVSRPGSGTARNAHWKAARKVMGDHVSGDKIVLNMADETVLVPEMSVDLIEPVRFAFVNPDNWFDLTSRFDHMRSTIIRGRTGYGKDATAIRLLLSDVEKIYHLDPDTDVTRLADSITRRTEKDGRAEGGIGFLLCQPREAAKLRGYTFHALDNALASANARLVITMSPDIMPRDNGLEPYVLDLPDDLLALRRIVLAHLRWRCNDEEVFTKLRADAAVEELIAELDQGDRSCQAAADLASIISSERTDEGAVNAGRVRERRRKQHDQKFDLWFDNLRGADERSFAIALAVLDGLPYEDVADAARRLWSKLELTQQVVVTGGAKPELRIARREPMQNPTSRLLDTLRAVERDEEARYEYGMVPVRVVAFRDDSYPLKIIERVWRGFQMQPTLLEWLYELLLSPSDRVRLYAANALGVLCGYSFDYLWNRSLKRWADSKDERLREAVAYALREPAADPRLLPSVNMVVGGWYGDVGEPRRQATAARAFGVCVGQPTGAAAIDRLGRLATIDEYNIAVAIGNALADLIMEDPDGMAVQVTTALVDWFADKGRTRAAELAFLILASTLVMWERPDPPGPEVQWPSLLRMANSVDELRAPLATLWRRMLGNSVLHAEANTVLTGWAALAENDTQQLTVLLRLISQVVQHPTPDPRIRRNLSWLVKNWIAPQNLNPLPKAHRYMSALLDKLEREGC